MTERDKLIKELEELIYPDRDMGAMTEHIADFILEDRERIVAPLVELGNISIHSPIWRNGGISVEKLCQAIEETLKLAGELI